MNPIITIGRFQIPIASVITTQKRTGPRSWLFPGYDVLLVGGIKLRLNNAEKAELDEARGIHEKTMETLYQVAAMQRANRPAGA